MFDTLQVEAYLLLTSVGDADSPSLVGTGAYRFRLRRGDDRVRRIDDLHLDTDNAW